MDERGSEHLDDADAPGATGALDALRDSVAGVSDVSRERAEKIVEDLAVRGQLRARDIQRAARDLMERSQRNRRELLRLIQKEVQRRFGTPEPSDQQPSPPSDPGA